MATDRRLFFLLHRAHRALLINADASAIEALGVTTAQLGALYYIAKHEGCSLTDVANVLDMNKSAVSAHARRLEASGMVRREANPSDARGARLFLTEQGKTVRAQSLAVIRRLNAEITAGFSAAEMDTVFRFLNVTVERFGVGDDSDDT